jgi:DNA-directed RNA polymerase alpha subunit
MKIISENNEKIKFITRGNEISLTNAYRRIMHDFLPTLAVDDVYVTENDSVIADDVIAQRLGLVPFTGYDINIFHKPAECTHGEIGCAQCKFDLLLRVTCDSKRRTVTTGDIKPLNINSTIRPFHDNIPITILTRGQTIDIRMVLTKNIGDVHAKWSPVCPSTYKIIPTITLSNKSKDTSWVNICPKNVFKVNGDTVDIENADQCTHCHACEESGHVDRIQLKHHNGADVVVEVESSGVYPARLIVNMAYNELDSRLKDLYQEISSV